MDRTKPEIEPQMGPAPAEMVMEDIITGEGEVAS
ncbi:MAG: FKBP-type peptidyl-prolyl cis-trans isomerase, partial [Microbacteriaceae bacterium]|nr:FKBP-type peptidyl-prolyl cis-trans isomerase [Microbacteriaceae bacterium]